MTTSNARERPVADRRQRAGFRQAKRFSMEESDRCAVERAVPKALVVVPRLALWARSDRLGNSRVSSRIRRHAVAHPHTEVAPACAKERACPAHQIRARTCERDDLGSRLCGCHHPERSAVAISGLTSGRACLHSRCCGASGRSMTSPARRVGPGVCVHCSSGPTCRFRGGGSA